LLLTPGGIYFREFSYFGPANVVGFAGGVACLVLGIYLLSPALKAAPDGDDGEEEALEVGLLPVQTKLA
jgi:hypothetical protein